MMRKVVKNRIKIIWAVSSVGKGHVMRDLAIVNRLETLAEVEVDWLAPDPAADFLSSRGHNVLACSSRLAGSGKTYERVFSGCSAEFNLMEYVRADTRLHRHDFRVSAEAWKQTGYDLIVGDEAFWLLTGFSSRWEKKPCPFIFLTDFIGTRAMRLRLHDLFTEWFNNLRFCFSHLGPDLYLYVGDAREIPGERLGFLLPGGRKWAEKHCRFVKPVVGFDPGAMPGKRSLRAKLELPEQSTLFLATIGPEGDYGQHLSTVEHVFEILKKDFPDACFVVVCPGAGTREWIRYHRFLDRLYEYFAAADFVITQSGYGKVAELTALGKPFIAIPLDYHFEQEYVMGRRLERYGSGKLVTMRDHGPEDIAGIVRGLMAKETRAIDVDTGEEVAGILLNVVGNEQWKQSSG